MSFFFFFPVPQEVEQVLTGGGTSRRREKVRKGCRRVNMVEILCTQVCKWRPVKTIPGRGEGIKKNGGGGKFKYNIFDIL
jgi:hypothetical protein